MLSSYRNKALAGLTARKGWYTLELRMLITMTNRYEQRDKIEVMTANYPISKDMIEDIKEPEPAE
ncbi:MAG: hypothetical protein LBG90_04070 [Spirochaetaceae bacterium]|nr:hypothetical protein [Spirochaetaceae bacterium]